MSHVRVRMSLCVCVCVCVCDRSNLSRLRGLSRRTPLSQKRVLQGEREDWILHVLQGITLTHNWLKKDFHP